MVLAGSGDFGTVQAMFGINDTQAITLAGYFQYMMNNLAVPMVQGAFAEGVPLFIASKSKWFVRKWNVCTKDRARVAFHCTRSSVDNSTTTIS